MGQLGTVERINGGDLVTLNSKSRSVFFKPVQHGLHLSQSRYFDGCLAKRIGIAVVNVGMDKTGT